MRYFRECEHCGGSLDPGEKCDCQNRKGRTYTAIEGAGYKPIPIRAIEKESHKKTG